MPNVTWQEPQVLVDLLAMNLFAADNGMDLPEQKEIYLLSPWISDVEFYLRPGPWYQNLTVGTVASSCTLQLCLTRFVEAGWAVHVAVLAYGKHSSGLTKDPQLFKHERRILPQLLQRGVRVFLLQDLHAKGVITPLGVLTGSTNLTTSGLYAQSQNANYFPHDHSDFQANRTQLLAHFQGATPVTALP